MIIIIQFYLVPDKNLMWILNIKKEQSSCRSRGASTATVSFKDDLFELIRIYLSESDINHCAYNRSYHIPEKSVGFYSKHQLVFFHVPPGFINFADVGSGAGVKLAEACKIRMME